MGSGAAREGKVQRAAISGIIPPADCRTHWLRSHVGHKSNRRSFSSGNGLDSRCHLFVMGQTFPQSTHLGSQQQAAHGGRRRPLLHIAASTRACWPPEGFGRAVGVRVAPPSTCPCRSSTVQGAPAGAGRGSGAVGQSTPRAPGPPGSTASPLPAQPAMGQLLGIEQKEVEGLWRQKSCYQTR